jgi:hypothetical protein
MKRPGTASYSAEELAYVVLCLTDPEKPRRLGDIAAELGRDRSGLHSKLKSLGLPTAPPAELVPQVRKRDVEAKVDEFRTLSRDEVKARILKNLRTANRPQIRAVS